MRPGDTILIDTRQAKGKHVAKHAFFEAAGLRLVRTKLYVGDYMMVGGTRVCDTKASIAEIAMDVFQQHERFRAELVNARDAGYSLAVLVENACGVRGLADLARWREPAAEFARRRNAVRRIDGARLAKACATMGRRYGARFEFCAPEEAGARVLEILEGGARGRGDA